MAYVYERQKLTKLRLFRLFIQLLVSIIINIAFFGIADTILVLPIQQPHGPTSIVQGSFYVLQRALFYGMIPFFAIATFFLIGAIFGRAWCAWGCPFGLVQDVIGYLPIGKYTPDRKTNKTLIDIAWTIAFTTIIISVLFGLTRILSSIGQFEDIRHQLAFISEEPFSVLDPAATLFSAIPYMIYWGTFPLLADDPLAELGSLDIFFWVRILILLISIILPLFIPRGYCRWFCPTGIIMGKIGMYSLIGIKRNAVKCNNCRDCEKACPMGVKILDFNARIRDELCTMCLDCVNACERGALEVTYKYE